MATSKVVSPKTEIPKVLIVKVITKSTSVDIKTPLGLHVVGTFDGDGYCEVEITPLHPKGVKYTCYSVPDMLTDVLDYTDAQFEELVSVARELRKAAKTQAKK